MPDEKTAKTKAAPKKKAAPKESKESKDASKAKTGGSASKAHRKAAKRQVARPKPKKRERSDDLRDALVEVLKEDRGLLVTEIVPLLQTKLQLDPHWSEKVHINSINENGVAALLSGDDKRFEVTEGSRWRLKGD